jgi:glutamate-1-semialdehyde 2,1-aminomutase
VIPTRARTTRLGLTLRALTLVSPLESSFEVVLVDDAPGPDRVTPFARKAAGELDLTILRTGGLGAASARNAGAAAGSAELLFFLDDDTLVTPRLLTSHVKAHADETATVAHGRVVDLTAFMFSPDPPPPAGDTLLGALGRKLGPADLNRVEELSAALGPRRSLIESIAAAVASNPELSILKWLLCIGTNTSMPRALFEAAGGFDPRYDGRWGGEDLELGFRLRRAGADFAALPATAYHLATARRGAEQDIAGFWALAAALHGEPALIAVSALLCRQASPQETAMALASLGQFSLSPRGTRWQSASHLNKELSMQQTATLMHTMTNAGQLDSIREVIPGGVSSSMRAQATPEPLVVQRARGDRIWDVEDRELIDLNMGYGPHLFGYADPEMADALARQVTQGAMTGLPHPMDRRAGELIARLVPSVEQVKFANSGTEAVASALRLARAATGRTLVLTFDGHYHGWSETVLRAGKATFHEPAPASGAPRPGALGMIPEALAHTLEVPWNDLSALRSVFGAHGTRIAAVICEPVMANACVVPPAPGQLEELRALCDRWGAWLVFDEVITGFRVGRGGAQERYGVTPDLTVLSKVMGGGVPVAAFGGSRDHMAMLVDHRAVHLGVYAGNHMSVRAVVTMLEKIERSPGTYEQLEASSSYFEHQLRSMFAEMKRPALVSRVGSLMSVSLLRQPADLSRGPRAAAQAMDFAAHRALQIRAQERGVYFHPSPIETWFLSTAHSFDDLDHAVAVLRDALVGVPGSR